MLRDFTKEPFDILILAGQSNAEGYGFGDVEDPYKPNDLVYTLDRQGILSRAAELVTGNEIQSNFALPFAREYLKAGRLAEGKKLLILRSAVGGTGFADHRWGIGEDLYLGMMDMIRTALAMNPQNRLVALLWHQGETDAANGIPYELHYQNLMGLLRSVRETFGAPDLPFLAGDFVPQWKQDNLAKAEPVSNAIRAVCEDCGKGVFVESEGLLSNLAELHRNPLGWPDGIHFSRKSVYELGKRYFAAYKVAVDR